jgi:uncharacterized protein YecT (DUF1311 family)
MRIAAAAILLAAACARCAAMECADQTQFGLDVCANAGFERADRALNDAYREIVRRLASDVRAKQSLIAAETAWIAFRDAECAFQASSSEGGSIHPMEVSLCLEDETRRRTKDLQAYLHCVEADLSCPVPAQ